MRTIVLLGELGKRFGRRHLLDVATPAEAIRALCANFRDFQRVLEESHERNVGYRVINVREDIDLDQLHYPAGRMIAIAPVIAGAKNPIVRILVGAAIVAAAFLTGGVALAATGLTFSGITGYVAFSVGVSLVLGGVSQMLAPPPKNTGGNDQKPSYIFDGALNTTTQGYPVPVGYGRMIVGSAVVSAGISTENYSG